MSKNKKIIIGLCILAAIILAFIGGNVLAKYQSQASGRGVADVAKWVFKVNGDSSTIQTISIAENYDESTLVNGKIAPGTEGSFNIIVSADGSDVGINYTVNFTNEKNKPTNLKFKYGNEEADTLTALANKLTGTLEPGEEKTLTVNWFWDYETGTGAQISANDTIDTNQGIADLNYTFDAVVTGTQVMPD